MARFRKKRDEGRGPQPAAPHGHPHAPYGGAPQGYPPQYGGYPPPGPGPQYGAPPPGAPQPGYPGPAPAPGYHGYPMGPAHPGPTGYPPPHDGPGPHGAPGPPGAPWPHDGPPPEPPAKLGWKSLITGVALRPSSTYWQMRDHPMWVPAILVSFLYGLAAVFGLEDARETVLSTTAGSLAPYLLVTGVAMIFGTLLLSTVTHALARQLGGNGHWAPTAGLAMLIMALTDVPRLALAVFLGGADGVVQAVGWATWLYAGVLMTMMVSRSHELPWPRALAASSIQLLGILMLVKLGTL